MILKANPKNKIPIYEDLRKVTDYDNHLINNHHSSNNIHTIPKPPSWTNKEYSSLSEIQILYKLECSCQDYKNKSLIFSRRDARKICKYLYWKLTDTKTSKYVDEPTDLLAHDAVSYKEWLLHKTTFDKRIMIVGYTNINTSGWMNVYFTFYSNGWLNLVYIRITLRKK